METSHASKDIIPEPENDPVKFDGNTPITTKLAIVVSGGVMLFSAGMGWMAYQNENQMRKSEIGEVSRRVLALEVQGTKIYHDIGQISKDIEYMTKMLEAEQRRQTGTGSGR